ncbi:zinc ribbon domain-containing protein [Priestia megaterium]|uniref:DUF6574 domain-containing protein n=1 Tax=Priestia megaterium TaxID=1404 RepID=UPI00114DA3D8|nr:zinc ribbon domain-containing protein [Priestia megaterium]MDC7771466.1 zinc ribbon domain-containing protein [Priestia megaterium]
MQCLNCGHLNEGGKFCVKCGAKLGEESTANQVAATNEFQSSNTYAQSQPNVVSQPAQPNQHVENAKHISKLYLGYFMQGIKSPTAVAQEVRGEQFINGLITLFLYAISIPLMLFFGWEVIVDKLITAMKEGTLGVWDTLQDFGFGDFDAKSLEDYMDLSFVDIVIKNSFYLLLSLAVIGLVAFAMVKLSKQTISLQDFFARFGTFLIVPTAIFLLGVVLAIIKSELFLYFLLLGLLGLFIAVPLTIASFRKNLVGGIDGLYGALVTYIAVVVVLFMVGGSMLDEMKEIIGHAVGNALKDSW